MADGFLRRIPLNMFKFKLKILKRKILFRAAVKLQKNNIIYDN